MSNNDNNDDNIIKIPSLAERDKIRRKKLKEENPNEPFINLPSYTKIIIATLFTIHIIGIALNYISPLWYDMIFFHLAFTPASWSGNTNFLTTSIITPITHMLIHAGWIHICSNLLMTTIFATITERWIGGKNMIKMFLIGGICGSLTHLAVEPTSIIPLVGASGGISSLFACSALMMFRKGMLGKANGIKHPLAIFLGIWIVISLIFGVITPEGTSIAWAAHLGGMFGGLAYARFVMKL